MPKGRSVTPSPRRLVPQSLPADTPQSPYLASIALKTVEEYFRRRSHPEPEREAIEFLRAHAGGTFVIPVMPMIERMALDRSIVISVDRDPSSQTAKRLAALHGIPRRQVSKVTKRMTGVGVSERRAAVQPQIPTPLHCRHPRLSRFAILC